MLALAATPAAARSADWQIFESTNMWDDSPLIGAGTERDNNILMVKCDKAKQSLFVLVQLGWLDIGFGERDIMWRVDDGPAIRAAWDQMDAGGASTYGNDAW